jgi:biotin synthase
MRKLRNDWKREEVEEVYHRPLIRLLFEAAAIHQTFHKPEEVRACSILSIQTGGCSEDCAYCAQSSKYNTGIRPQKILDRKSIIAAAKAAKDRGCSRFSIGTAGRKIHHLDYILELVSEIKGLGLEVCCTLGMVNEEEANKLKEAGVYAYNHNLDTGESYYPSIISTRTYQDRLQTLKYLRQAGLKVCCGGIIGMGESDADRIDLIHTLATFPEHPETVPINQLIPIKGTPLEKRPLPSIWEAMRMIATVRLTMPRSIIGLAAGRHFFSKTEQTLCFLAGANAIYLGGKLLTAQNCDSRQDEDLFQTLGLQLADKQS